MRPIALLFLALLLSPALLSGASRSKNVILFLADAGGIPTLNAASLHGYSAPRHLFVQQMPHIGLSETSTASQLVTDSAAGMTAIVTGQRTHNGVIAQSASAVRGAQDGEPLKTILEYAEERGLATGIITNDSLAGATPAALYAKSNERATAGSIFPQLFAPRFGDGVDVMIGPGRPVIAKAVTALGGDLGAISIEKQRPLLSSLAEMPADARRAIVLLDSNEFDLGAAVQTAIRMLSRNRKGYFLMVESDVHTDRPRRGLDRMVAFDGVIRSTAAAVGRDTLLLFTADHSFDVRVYAGRRDQPLLAGYDIAAAPEPSQKMLRLPNVRMDNSHTGEEVLVAAQGPGAERVRGYMANTDLFGIMMAAYGWRPDATLSTR
jgi:alkaline phosphatase